MKKKILSIILSLLLFIPCMFLFTACGEDHGVHLLYAGPESAETKDPGLFSMRVKYIPMWKADIENAENPDGEQPEGGDTEEDEEDETQQPDWINKTLSLSYRDKVSFSGGDIFFTIITLELNQGYEIGDLKVLLNGEEAELHIVQGDGILLSYSLGYRFIEETTILTFEGQTKPIEYTFNIGLVNYDSFKDSERFSDLRFSGVIRNVTTDGTAPTVKEIFTYDDKTEFKPDEFVEALRNTPISYFEDLVVSMYFKNRDKIIPQFSEPWEDSNQPAPPYFFTELEGCWYHDENTPLWAWNDELEYKLCFDRNAYNNMLGKQPRFNFSALSFLTLEEMKYVTAIGDCSWAGDMPTDIINSLRNVEVYEQSFIVTIDGQETEVDSLAFADLRKSTNTKVKIKVPKTLARIVDSDAVVSLYTTAESNFDNINTIELNKETNFARESVSNDVNYEYIIVDIDDIKPYKTHEDTSNKLLIGFNIDPDALLSNISELKTLKIKSTTNDNSSGLVKEVIYEETLNLYPYKYNESDDSHIYLSAENIDYKFGLSYLSSS